ncbi:MAG: CoA transferase [Deltaproteobacteria bacterium]|nr:CoA transferase [Deltaproteobacteria bacterium]MBW2395947.1 CoA transferase [Deltaproteobacteria bacterium]
MLNGYRVLDLSDDRGQMCGMMLADLGADVICVEPPDGNPARQLGPFADDEPGTEKSLFWWSYARGKRSVVLDRTTDEGHAALRKLAAAADVWIESEAPGALAAEGFGYEELAELNPGLVYVSITAFGQDGPKAGWPATDLTLLAAGGPLWLTGDDDRAPVRVRVPQAFFHAAGEATVAALVALHERHRSGLGQHVDISAQQAVTLATQSDSVATQVGEDGAKRCAGGLKVGPLVVRFGYPAVDGHVSITHLFGSTVGPATARLMACVHEDGFCDQAMRDTDWVDFAGALMAGKATIEGFEAAKNAIAAWTASKTKQELLALALEHRLLIAPVATPEDVVGSEQFEARSYLVRTERPDGKGHTVACGPWAKLSKTPLTQGVRAPRLGEHQNEILEAWRERRALPAPTDPSGSGALPLEGVKILDFMWALAGPMATRVLSDYGATVIRVESTSRLDVIRTIRPFVGGADGADTSATFHSVNTGKQMLTLDLTHPEARQVILDLVQWADVVCESFAPGTMAKLGFDYETLRMEKPELIMLSTCLMGQTGPISRFAGYGNLAAAVCGFSELTGWRDRAPASPFGAYTDYIAPRFNASALLAALEHLRRTGEGQHIDLSQAEAALHWLAPAVLARTTNGDTWTREGNRDEELAPHGCYPVDGEDRWIALATRDDAEWEALCEVLGATGLTSDARFSSLAARHGNADALDRALAELTAGRDGAELETALIARGIPAHRVLDSQGLAGDPQLQARGHFVRVEGGSVATVVEASRSRLSRTPARVPSELPSLGAANFDVLSELLGYDDERFAELAVAGVLE